MIDYNNSKSHLKKQKEKYIELIPWHIAHCSSTKPSMRELIESLIGRSKKEKKRKTHTKSSM
jgi:hypothetical protein